MDQDRTLQFRLGLFTLVVLLGLAAMILFLTREGGLFIPRTALYADFDNIDGLTVNAPVYLAGNSVGRVKSIYFLAPGAEHAIRTELDMDARVMDRVNADSIATVRTTGLLGDKYVEVTLGSVGGKGLGTGSSLRTEEPPNLNQLADKGVELLDNLIEISASTNAMFEEFGDSMGGRSLAATLELLSQIARDVQEGDGLLHALVYEGDGNRIVRELHTSIRTLNAILSEIQEGEGSLHALIYSREELKTLERVAAASTRLDSILTKIDEGEGTLGALVNDPTVYEDIKILVGGARRSALVRSLINFVRQNED
ncbi:MAG: MCE family protein [Myxococcales bacterium]|nr:MCE family protein [Myxococcales bacterium]